MKFTDIGTGDGIGASCHCIDIGPFRVVVDAGMNPREVGTPSLPRFDLIDTPPDAIILTHCHLDHLGALPVIARRFPDAPILMSLPSAMLAGRMLHNSVNVMFRQREGGSQADLPLYTHGEVDRMEHRVLPMAFKRPRELDKNGETLKITLHPAGHVAGAASVELQWRGERLLHTGDVLFDSLAHLAGARLPEGPFDVLVTETTRGRSSRVEGTGRDAETMRLLETIEKTILGGGSVLMPVFALGRAQEMLCVLHQARKLLPRCAIFSAGLGMDLAARFDEITRKTGLVRFRANIVSDLKVRTLEADLRPGRTPEKGIYLLGSGMMTEGTPSYAAAATLLHDPASTICMVGYCDPDTPGGALIGAEQGDDYLFAKLDYKTQIKAKVEKFDLSGHADREQLLDYAIMSQARTILLVHGDALAREWFQASLGEALPQARVLIPEPALAYQL